MCKAREIGSVIVVLSAAAFLAAVQPASAAKKAKQLTYDEAWKVCTDYLNRNHFPKDASARYSAGAACMLKHGYRI